MKKIISVCLALVLAFVCGIPAFATDVIYMGDVNCDGRVSAIDARIVLQAAVEVVTLTDKEYKLADIDGDGKIRAVDARIILQTAAEIVEKVPFEEEANPDNKTMTRQELIDFLNAETAKAMVGTYSLTREREYRENGSVVMKLLGMDVTDAMNEAVQSSAPDRDVNDLIGLFIDVDTEATSVTDGVFPEDFEADEKNVPPVSKQMHKDTYGIAPMRLSTEDVVDFSVSGSTYTIALKNSANPRRGGISAVSHVTNDFVIQEDVVSYLDAVSDGKMTAKDLSSTYTDTVVSVTVSEGKISEMTIYYAADLEFDYVVSDITFVTTCGIYNKTVYSDITY